MQQYLRPLLQRIKPLLHHPRAALIAGATAAAAAFTYLLARRRRHSLRYVGFEGTYNGRARICNSPIGGRHSRLAEEDAKYNGAMDLEGTELIIVRHGKTVWNEQGKVQGACDSPLVRDGKTGAKAVGRRLRYSTRPIVAIYASPLGRAWKTAELIARGMGFHETLIPDYDLRERAFGVLEGLTWQEMQEQQPEAHRMNATRDEHYAAPGGGESRAEVRARMLTCVERIARKHPGERILCVTHSGCMASLVRAILGMPTAANSPELPNTAINLLVWKGGGWRLKLWGDIGEFNESRCAVM